MLGWLVCSSPQGLTEVDECDGVVFIECSEFFSGVDEMGSGASTLLEPRYDFFCGTTSVVVNGVLL